ncbi:MAG TPA: pyridoxamine 5'-phosphate oxidase family protein [Acidimicrobiales bacterium]|nr:pyridoxamine 5'-phosphate oxidase family protein [Acidimicrobiales bacterium]
MSLAVELASLRAQIAASGDAVFLLSVRDGARPHAVSAVVTWDGDELVTTAGSRSSQNIGRAPAVSLLWPAAGQDYSLIVDGTARVADGRLRITPTHAVLHRSVLAAAPSGHEDGDDPRCKPVLD